MGRQDSESRGFTEEVAGRVGLWGEEQGHPLYTQPLGQREGAELKLPRGERPCSPPRPGADLLVIDGNPGGFLKAFLRWWGCDENKAGAGSSNG